MLSSPSAIIAQDEWSTKPGAWYAALLFESAQSRLSGHCGAGLRDEGLAAEIVEG